MHSETDSSGAVEVELPAALLAEVDAYAAVHGYTSRDSVVREALDRLE
jgi:metal-responsive CopG/Arc/MetJ family transcriptional regulator